ncbi:MAG: DUF3488 domain-containing protein [Bryobacterales bacterium]|nr:DUF3488 domain-containing protein [Bryobacterales bacterium]
MPAASSIDRFFHFSLWGMVACGFLAIAGAGFLDPLTIGVAGAGILLRLAMVLGLAAVTIPASLLNILTIAYIGFYPIDYHWFAQDFLTATLRLLLFVVLVRILSARSERDYLLTAVLSLLEILAAALVSVQANFFVCLGLYLVFGVATLTSAEMRRAARRPGKIATRNVPRRVSWRLAVLAGSVSAGVLVLTAVLFFLLPRTARAALQHLAAHGAFVPGFSNEVNLGNTGDLRIDRTPVMRVRFFNQNGRLETRWRGNALVEFDGKRWFNVPQPEREIAAGVGGAIIASDDQRQRMDGYRVMYRVDLQPLGTSSLFLAGRPEHIRIAAPVIYRNPFGGYRMDGRILSGVRYDVSSFFEGPKPDFDVPGSPVPDAIRLQYLRLPPIDPRIPTLARSLTEGMNGHAEQARAIERHLRTAYRYALALPKEASRDPLASFLFERREGHCEYFASAMAVMLRWQGIPARVVTGFLGGEYNPVSGMYIVRASDAHSWVEAWLPGRGWVEYDPTPADPNPRSATALGRLFSRIAWYLDAADLFWHDWVISYDLGRQLFLADQIGESSRRASVSWVAGLVETVQTVSERVAHESRTRGPGAAGILLLLAAAVFGGPRLWRKLRLRFRVRRLLDGHGSTDEVTAVYARFLELMQARGYSKPAWYTPAEFAHTLRATECGSLAEAFTRAYQDARFGGKLDAVPKVSALLEELERSPAR